MGKIGLSSAPKIKKAVSMNLKGTQHFTAKVAERDVEIDKFASQNFQGKIAGVTAFSEEAASESQAILNIRETANDLSPQDLEDIKKVVENAECKETKGELEAELGKTEALLEKALADIKRFALIADELLEDLPEESIKLFMVTDDAKFYSNVVKKAKK